VTNFEIMPKPPERENKLLTWPQWPLKLRTSSSHEEGAEREFAVMTEKFSGNGNVERLHCIRVDNKLKPIPDSAFELKADLVLLAMGFVGAERAGMLSDLGVKLTDRGNVWRDPTWMTSVPGVFACGDMQRGQSLIVWAIAEGRSAARGVDLYLMGKSALPAPLS
jgi:glutamate synthase (NADPH/NADH) small chain